MHYEDILIHIGPFGKYQKLLVFALFLVFIPPPFHFIGQVFLAANTDHWCAVPASQMINCSQLQLAECQEEQKSYSIPYEIDDDGNKVYSSCERYVMNDEDVGRNMSLNSTDVISCDAGWKFDHSRYKSTINEDFSLVCDRQDLPAYAQSVWFAGLLVGSLVWGSVGDWIGRRKTFILTVILVTISSTVTSFVPNFTAYTAMRFFTAACAYGIYLMIYVLASEIVGPKNRVGATTALLLAFPVGYMILSLLAFLLREWRHLQLAISLPFVLTFLVMIVFPESPRWLITKGRYKEAAKIIEKIAKVNGTEAPEDLLDKLSEDSKENKKQPSRIPVTQLDLIRTPNLRKKTLILWVDWFVVNMVYYGLSLSTSALGVDDYLAAFVFGAIEIPSNLFCWYVMNRFGRRITLVAFYIFGGVFCLITIFIPLGAARAAVALLGKFAISAAFSHIYIYSLEIYPTIIRSIGMGTSSMVARVSGILCPIILNLGKYWEPLPLCVFGGSAIIAGVLSLMLPETMGYSLPDTIQDGENFGSKSYNHLLSYHFFSSFAWAEREEASSFASRAMMMERMRVPLKLLSTTCHYPQWIKLQSNLWGHTYGATNASAGPEALTALGPGST
ncbi:organic cation transporter protein-like [Patiria miniata]|uniref:Major facilitator superfamily (MFS) profile domain-containing protein n=1 Tax=Patiria miniata TaxID=46514 RepID=A0A914BJM9_PATMI|nr:organic cation transporter protein-like [Patiria miniata]